MFTYNKTDRFARYVISAVVVLTATLAGLLVHATLGIRAIA